MNAWFSFNGVNFSKWLKLLGDNRTVLPPRKVTNVEVKNGVIPANKRWEERQIEIDVLMLSESYEEQKKMMREMAPLLALEEGELIFFDEPELSYKAFVSDFTDFSGKGLLKKGKIVFQISEPMGTGLKKQVQLNSENNTINYEASAEAMPVFAILFEEDSSDLVFEKDNKPFRLIRSFKRGDRVWIDTEKGLIRHNDELAMPILDLRSRFTDLFLKKGENHFNLPDNVEIEAVFNEKWY